ncbi:MAG: biopolymer transporter ExbD [bacterium]
MRQKREEEYLNGNLTAMIDVVFQLIIFFVCTTNLQDKAIDDRIKLAMAPNGKVETRKNPYEVKVYVAEKGGLSIARTPLSADMLTIILKKSRADARGNEVPVLIMADARAKHSAVKKAMDACTAAGIWKIKFTALKEKA